MSNRLKELREQRNKIVVDMRAILDAAEAEKRAPTDEEQSKYDELFSKAEEVRKQAETEERQIELEREMAARDDEARRGDKRDGGENADLSKAEQAFRSWLKTGSENVDGMAELRALSVGTETDGGYLVPPQQFVQDLIKFMDNQTFIRGMATKYQVPMAQSLGAPSLDTDPDAWAWTTELSIGNEDSSMAFGKRVLYPHPLSGYIKISRELLRQSLLPADQLVMQRLGYTGGIVQEQAFLTGTGANQPLGVFTADANGISTGRDVSTGNATTSIGMDGLLEAKYSLKAQYQKTSSWLFHRDGVKQVAKLKDGDGQYLWQPSTQADQPDRLWGRPVMMSEYVPNTFTTGQYVGMFGDFRHYWIADAYNMEVQRLNELFAAANQIGFVARLKTDGMPVLEEAFARIKLA